MNKSLFQRLLYSSAPLWILFIRLSVGAGRWALDTMLVKRLGLVNSSKHQV